MVCMWFVCGNFDVFPNRQMINLNFAGTYWNVLVTKLYHYYKLYCSCYGSSSLIILLFPIITAPR